MTTSNETKSPLIKPTIGRKVWFWPNGSHIGVPAAVQPQSQDPGQAMDATVVFVHGDRMVNLLVLDHHGGTWPVRSVTLRQAGDATPQGMYAQWMPYQVGQAKLDEAKSVKAEQDVVIVGAGHPCIGLTPADIDAAIVREIDYAFPNTTVTVCLLTLRNGAKVIGHNYGAIDTSRHSAVIGRLEARKMAVEKVWELEGYLLRERLAALKR